MLFRRMREMPDFIFLTTRKYNETIIHEANFARIPIAALVDTDDDCRLLQYMVPCNTQSPQSVHFVLDMITRGILEAQVTKPRRFNTKKLFAPNIGFGFISCFVQMGKVQIPITHLYDQR